MTREIIRADALEWLAETDLRGAVVTSLPDADEIELSVDQWLEFYKTGLDLCLAIADPVFVIYATDRLYKRRWISKATMIHEAILRAGFKPVWHKISLRREAGKIDLHRPGYSHLIAAAKGKVGPGKRTQDVFRPSRSIYENGAPINAARLAVSFALSASEVVIDPFCGRGTFVALAEYLGAKKTIGIDIDPNQCAAARRLKIKRL